MLETILQFDDREERCGLILTDGTIVEIENVAEDKVTSYKMNPAAVMPFIDNELVAGTWHTHPDSDPNLSGEDYSGFLSWPKLEHSIIGRRGRDVVVMRYRVENGLVISCD